MMPRVMGVVVVSLAVASAVVLLIGAWRLWALGRPLSAALLGSLGAGVAALVIERASR